MLQSGQNWEFFGYDMRNLGKAWRMGWREFLNGYGSPVKSRFDEVVAVNANGEIHHYQGGKLAQQAIESTCKAVLLPGDYVLAKTLQMPSSVEMDLESVMGYEVLANSPFPETDTGFGWQLVDKNDTHIRVDLAVVSLSATMAYLAREHDVHEINANEVWAEVNENMLVLSGFGEGRRERLYRKRLVRAVLMLGYCAAVVIVLAGAAAFSKYLELQQYEAFASDIQREAGGASTMRESVLRANDTISAVNEMLRAHPNPHYELGRLTQILGDESYLESLSVNGREMRLRGRASNASELMELLIKDPAYSTVTAPQAIVKTPDGQERFTLSVTLAGAAES
jgi:general secretion pathway protein L